MFFSPIINEKGLEDQLSHDVYRNDAILERKIVMQDRRIDELLVEIHSLRNLLNERSKDNGRNNATS